LNPHFIHIHPAGLRSAFILISVLSHFSFVALFSQGPDTSRSQSGNIDQIIEDAMTDMESEDETDWTVFTDQLEDFRSRPLDLNQATRDDLLLLPGMNAVLADYVLKHIEQFGPFLTVFELQAVPGMQPDIFRKIAPFIQVKAGTAKDINTRLLHPHGPSFSAIKSGIKHELLLRTVLLLEQEKGYTNPDTTSTGTISSRYLGSPSKQYLRYRMRYNQNVSLGLVAEKDAGEKYTWDPGAGYFGFDFLSAHVFLRDFGKLKRFVAGDYTIQCGQGLLLSSGLGFGKGSETIMSVKRTDYGIRPFSSVNENQFLRGAAATMGFGKLNVTGFFSGASKDANITLQDTVTNEIAEASSLQTSGLHRTNSEISDRRSLTETLIGSRLEFHHSRLKFGILHFFQQYSNTINPGTSDYQLYDFRGDQNYLTSVDFDFTYRNFNFFGEFGRSMSGGTGAIGGFLGSLDPKLDVSVLVRRFDRDFHSFRGFVFAERPTTIQNETGIYAGIQIRPASKVLISGYADQFWFPWHRYLVSYPSSGREFMGQLEYKPSRSSTMYVRFRSDHKEKNASDPLNLESLEYLVPTTKQSIRFQFQKSFEKVIDARTRIERSWYQQGNEESSTGFLAAQDVTWKLNPSFDLTMRYAVFDVSDYNARIYAFENDVLGFFSIPAYSGKGSRYYIILNVQPQKNLEFWLRFAQWHYLDQTTVGSGLSEISGNKKSEVKVQMKLTF